MIWLTWRQFRGQAVTAVAVLAVLATYLVLLGLRIRQSYEDNTGCTGCSPAVARATLDTEYSNVLLLSGLLVVAVPAFIGAFWGAPLIARELETGTYRLVWNQSVTRSRWLAVKLGFVVLAGVAVAGALSLLLTWAASPYDELLDGRFAPLTFPTRNIVPFGYAVFAVVLGAVVGLLAKRTVLAMAITLVAFLALQIVIPTAIRPHLQPSVTETVTFSAETRFLSLNINESGAGIRPSADAIPGAWVLSGRAPLLDSAGDQVTTETARECMSGSPEQAAECLSARGWYYNVTYHPADRYWTFQWLEFAGYLALAGLLAGTAFWRIRRGLH